MASPLLERLQTEGTSAESERQHEKSTVDLMVSRSSRAHQGVVRCCEKPWRHRIVGWDGVWRTAASGRVSGRFDAFDVLPDDPTMRSSRLLAEGTHGPAVVWATPRKVGVNGGSRPLGRRDDRPRGHSRAFSQWDGADSFETSSKNLNTALTINVYIKHGRCI